MDKKNLPIKILIPRSDDLKPVPPGGGGKKFFDEVTPQFRQTLINRFQEFSSTVINDRIPVVGKVTLKQKAIAKSHRPTALLNEKTCPIVGCGKFGELFIEITNKGLSQLTFNIAHLQSEQFMANLTTIDSISPVTSEQIVSNETLVKLKNRIKTDNIVKVELFNFSKEEYNIELEKSFKEFINSSNSLKVINEIEYSDSLKIYKLSVNSEDDLNNLVQFRGIKNLSFFPDYLLVTPQLQAIDQNLSAELLLPKDNVDYPIIGMVDSGIAENHPILSNWVHHRERFVAAEEMNCNHGSFVGGIIVFGDHLLENPPENFFGAKVIDIVAVPNGDRNYGPVGELKEDELVEILNQVIPKYKDIAKVWNLSLGTEEICCVDKFSDLAVALDHIQKQHTVVFVISSGNYENKLRTWPPQPDILNDDILTCPADSVVGLSVGSLTHRESGNSVVKKEKPSPFSRRGPGPNYIIKPELVHYGGNCSVNGDCLNLGVVSFDEYGIISEDVGTSYSAPRVSGLLGRVFSSLSEPPSINLAKALLIHSTRQQEVAYIPTKDEINYYGFGRPATLESILTCSQSSVTLIYEGQLLPGRYIEIPDFPYPKSLLRGNKWFGEIWVTLVYDPPLNSKHGQEYCRTNVDVHMGTYTYYEEDGKMKMNFKRQVPPEHKLGAQLERELVESGFKWSPVKLFHRKLSKGTKQDPWRLTLDLLLRSEEVLKNPQSFALIITIKDDKGNDIYSEMVHELNQRFLHKDLQLKENIRTTLKV